MVYILLPSQSHSALLSSFILYMDATDTNACIGVSSPFNLCEHIKRLNLDKHNRKYKYKTSILEFRWNLMNIDIITVLTFFQKYLYKNT